MTQLSADIGLWKVLFLSTLFKWFDILTYALSEETIKRPSRGYQVTCTASAGIYRLGVPPIPQQRINLILNHLQI